MNNSTTVKTLMISLVTIGFLGGAAAMADQVGSSVASKKVNFNDLNLTTSSGQQVALERVDRLARTLCSQVADPTDLSHHASYLACLDATVAKASVSLQALVQKQSTSQFARADVK